MSKQMTAEEMIAKTDEFLRLCEGKPIRIWYDEAQRIGALLLKEASKVKMKRRKK